MQQNLVAVIHESQGGREAESVGGARDEDAGHGAVP
jgi:hypothetical protein